MELIMVNEDKVDFYSKVMSLVRKYPDLSMSDIKDVFGSIVDGLGGSPW
jgi:hypothetical protein